MTILNYSDSSRTHLSFQLGHRDTRAGYNPLSLPPYNPNDSLVNRNTSQEREGCVVDSEKEVSNREEEGRRRREWEGLGKSEHVSLAMMLVYIACADSNCVPSSTLSAVTSSSLRNFISSLSVDVSPLSLPSLLSLLFHFHEHSSPSHLSSESKLICPNFPKEVIAHAFEDLSDLTSRKVTAGSSVRNVLLENEDKKAESERERLRRERDEKREKFSDLTSPMNWTISLALFLTKVTFSAFLSIQSHCTSSSCPSIGIDDLDIKWMTKEKMEKVTAIEYVKRCEHWITSQVMSRLLLL
jgi:hypothetical protein